MDIFLQTVLILGLTGTLAGLGAGILGVGGGFVMVPVQYWVLTDLLEMDSTLATRVAFATSLAVILPTAIATASGHSKKGAVAWDAVKRMCVPPGFFMAIAGAYVATSVHGDWLRYLFGALLLGAAVKMALKPSYARDNERDTTVLMLIVAGAIFGFLSGLLGIGGGYLIVLFLTLVSGYEIHRAVGTSTAFLIFASAGGGARVYFIRVGGLTGIPPAPSLGGYVDLHQWVILVVTSIPASFVGVSFRTVSRPVTSSGCSSGCFS
ncbi:sulfite exporter TauE/SafE family protein [Methanogenium cariaci]|uniref:sulfite exporter TauE/SafE family protein n=1 Tax=Methanogenium cariaci TaxID=2197 RepID=UPI000781868A|nr:sulfite exporter TauE/SafE family protein [Methanogenium cariaci]